MQVQYLISLHECGPTDVCGCVTVLVGLHRQRCFLSVKGLSGNVLRGKLAQYLGIPCLGTEQWSVSGPSYTCSPCNSCRQPFTSDIAPTSLGLCLLSQAGNLSGGYVFEQYDGFTFVQLIANLQEVLFQG